MSIATKAAPSHIHTYPATTHQSLEKSVPMADHRVFRFHDSDKVFFGAMCEDLDEVASARGAEDVVKLNASTPRLWPKRTPGFAPARPQEGSERKATLMGENADDDAANQHGEEQAARAEYHTTPASSA